jgi:hypothetical protein
VTGMHDTHPTRGSTPEPGRGVDVELPPWAEAWTRWMDDGVGIPGTSLRFGLDPVIGFLLPGLGDTLSGIGAVSLLILGFYSRLPKIVLGRMIVNVAVDVIVGSVPILGDLFDVGWKANRKNLVLIRRFRDTGSAKPSLGDYVVVTAAVAVVLALALLPVALVAIAGGWIGRRL